MVIYQDHMDKEVTIIKRNGAKELFDPEKITRVVQAAGLRPVDAAELTDKVVAWIEKQSKRQFTSIEIRDKVFKEIEKIDKYASGLFAWYQNLKDQKYAATSKND